MKKFQEIYEASKKSARKTNTCWKGYKQLGYKKNEEGRSVPNCVPIEETNWEPSIEEFSEHLQSGLPIFENKFRVGSENFFRYINEFRQVSSLLGQVLSEQDEEFLNTDIGEFAIYGGENVPLDCPMWEAEDKGVELNSPKRGGSKKYYVYVKNDKGNVVKVQFGDTSGLKAKIDDPEARKSFVARHKCSEKKDKTKAGYWACRLPYYAKQLGLSGGGKFYW